MKKFSALPLSVLLFASCSSTDDSDKQSEGQIKKTANLQGSGDSANDILSNNTFSKLSLEIAYVKGFKPADETLINFTDFIKSITFKNDIAIKLVELDSPNEEDLTTEEVAKLETENRTIYNSDDTLAIYIYFADAPSNNDDEDTNSVTLGAVFRNTSMVIYEETVRILALQSSAISVADVESATLNHEFGHLFGLVNLGSTPVNNHEDTEALNHCNVEGCLMRAELQFGGSSGKSSTAKTEIKSACSLNGTTLLQLLQSKTAKSNAVAIDAECILDLQANGGR